MGKRSYVWGASMKSSQIETLTNIVRELGEATIDQVWAECDEIYSRDQVRDGLQNARKVGRLVNDGRHPPHRGERYAKQTVYRAVEPKVQTPEARPVNSVFALVFAPGAVAEGRFE